MATIRRTVKKKTKPRMNDAQFDLWKYYNSEYNELVRDDVDLTKKIITTLLAVIAFTGTLLGAGVEQLHQPLLFIAWGILGTAILFGIVQVKYTVNMKRRLLHHRYEGMHIELGGDPCPALHTTREANIVGWYFLWSHWLNLFFFSTMFLGLLVLLISFVS